MTNASSIQPPASKPPGVGRSDKGGGPQTVAGAGLSLGEMQTRLERLQQRLSQVRPEARPTNAASVPVQPRPKCTGTRLKPVA